MAGHFDALVTAKGTTSERRIRLGIHPDPPPRHPPRLRREGLAHVLAQPRRVRRGDPPEPLPRADGALPGGSRRPNGRRRHFLVRLPEPPARRRQRLPP